MASARADVEALIQRHTAAIAVLADALLGARWMTLPGVQVAHILERNGVQQAQAPGATRAQPPDVSSHRRGPQRDATSFGFERRRGGLTLPSANPDLLRVTAAFERRTDGCFV
jgi:hypothetical protein